MAREPMPGIQVILTHEHADFDAVASMVGLARLIPGAIPVLPRQLNANVTDFLTLYGADLELRRRDDVRRGRVEHAWLVDTHQAQSIRGMTPTTPRTVIDHHLHSDPPDAAVEHDLQPVGATATIVVERMVEAGIRPRAVEATLLVLGIYEDTGSLTFAQTTPRDLRAAAWLIDAGADLEIVARFLRYPLSDAGRSVLQALLERAEHHPTSGHDVVVATAPAIGFADEVATLASKLMDLLEPAALIALLDLGGHVQLVARSITDDVDVSRVAGAVGGGGHGRAAAAVVRGATLDEARDAVLAALPGAVAPATRVADVMSAAPLVTLGHDQSVASALEVARRRGHEGFPVVDGDRLLGLVTRRALDRAAQHGMAAMPVERLLGSRLATVGPGDSVDVLQSLMMEHDAGQVAVLDEGRLVGIVTRTDLVRMWSQTARRTVRAQTVDLPAALAPPALRAARRVAEVALERGEGAYLVGGLPRDVLLGMPAGPDIDIVVEGDAGELARAVADRHGGRVRAHRRFGTAKWIHPDATIDLVSARAEYYAQPTALPQVERGSLRSDLRRRDFTINAIAIDLRPDRFGQVTDYFGGVADLEGRRIRVLHSLSFVDDPTRILRAVRLAHRLRFDIEPRTRELVPHAVGLLERVSGARLLAELRQLFAESEPAHVLGSLDEMGVLEAVSPGLQVGPHTREILDALPPAWAFFGRVAPGMGLPAAPAGEHALVLWLREQPGESGLAAARRLRLPGRWVRLLASMADLGTRPGVVHHADAPPSRVHARLSGTAPDALVLAWLCSSDPTARRHILDYGARLSVMRTLITGADLMAMGLPRGPAYRAILDEVLRARLDGEVDSRDDELALAARVATRLGNGARA